MAKRRLLTGSLAYIFSLGVTIILIAKLPDWLSGHADVLRVLLNAGPAAMGKETWISYPHSIQVGLYLITAVAMAELWIRWRAAEHEHRQIAAGLLPDDPTTVLEFSDRRLSEIHRRAAQLHDNESGHLARLIDLSITQLFSSRSAAQTLAIFTSSVEITAHRVDLRYQFLRYLSWMIPTIGFIGTVVGISYALFDLKPNQLDMDVVVRRLSVSFDTTLVALLISLIVLFFQNMVQKREESALNLAAGYCLSHLINRLYIRPEPVAHQGGPVQTLNPLS